MARKGAISWSVSIFLVVATPMGTTAQPPREAAVRARFADNLTRGVVDRAVRGAARRLERPGCARLLTDFEDRSGRALNQVLNDSGMTPSGYLTDALWFVDGDQAPQCRTDNVTVAFTAAGSRVIQICGARFADRFEHRSAQAEILVIHELLHALGLGENPPSGAEITRKVMARCGVG